VKPPKKTGPGLTPAQRAAEAAFTSATPPLTADQQLKKDFEENRERLKALRLARDTELTKKA
jgi:hypothetical protein